MGSFVVIELDRKTKEHMAYYYFETNDYRSTISFTYFFHGKKERNRSKDKIYHGTWKDIFDMTHNPYYDGGSRNPLVQKILKERYDKIPKIQLKSIWDFYEFIGYDYKKKKYIADA